MSAWQRPEMVSTSSSLMARPRADSLLKQPQALPSLVIVTPPARTRAVQSNHLRWNVSFIKVDLFQIR